MNGIDAVCVATGQDWRAIEAACHSYASTKGHYGPLTEYWIDQSPAGVFYLCGSIELPINAATVGGVIRSNPTYQHAFKLMGDPDSQQLAQIMACIGLSSNLAALRVLVSEGLTRGHMSCKSNYNNMKLIHLFVS